MSLKYVVELKLFRLESDLLEDLSPSKDVPFTPSLLGWSILNQFYSGFSDADKRSILDSLNNKRVG